MPFVVLTTQELWAESRSDYIAIPYLIAFFGMIS